jgi:glycosyltransferase involved in cell wall biosynthesis
MPTPVSVIIPVYNGSKTISECIENLKKKNKNQKLEIIIINDGSTDNTINILDKINNIKVISLKKNKGVGYARQYGTKVAKFDTLCYLDSDVFVSKDSIKKLVKKLKSNKSIGSTGAIQKTVNLNKENWSSNFVCLKSCYGFDDVKKDVEFSVIHSEFCLISRKYLNSIGGWKYFAGAGGEEFELGHRILASEKKIILIKDANYITYYPSLLSRFFEVIGRTEKYVALALKRKKFDTKGSFATSGQAFSALITGFYALIITASFLLTVKINTLLLPFFLIQFLSEFSFLKYAFKIYGLKMFFYSLLAIQVINFGIILGTIKFISKKILKY